MGAMSIWGPYEALSEPHWGIMNHDLRGPKGTYAAGEPMWNDNRFDGTTRGWIISKLPCIVFCENVGLRLSFHVLELGNTTQDEPTGPLLAPNMT